MYVGFDESKNKEAAKLVKTRECIAGFAFVWDRRGFYF